MTSYLLGSWIDTTVDETMLSEDLLREGFRQTVLELGVNNARFYGDIRHLLASIAPEQTAPAWVVASFAPRFPRPVSF